MVTALGVAAATEAFLLLAGRMWGIPLLNTTLSSLATAAGQSRLGGGTLVYVLWLVLTPLACGAFAARLTGRTLGRSAFLVGAVCGAVSVSVPTVRLPDEEIPRYRDIIVQAAEEISKRMGYRVHQSIEDTASQQRSREPRKRGQ